MRNAWLVALVLAAPALADDPSPRRKPFTSKDGGFSVVMPASPTRKELSVPTPLGPIELQMYIVEQDGVAYFASYADYPEDYVAKNDPQQMLDGAQSGAIGNVKGELVSDSKIELDGNPGREFEFDFPKVGGPIPGGGGKARVYLVKNRLYQLQVLGKKEQVDDPSADRYLDSFKLTASKPAADDDDDEPKAKSKPKPKPKPADDDADDDDEPKAKKAKPKPADDDADDDDEPKAKKAKPKPADDDADDDDEPKAKSKKAEGGDDADEEKMEKPEA